MSGNFGCYVSVELDCVDMRKKRAYVTVKINTPGKGVFLVIGVLMVVFLR